jgi:hypothetical protein
MGFSLIMEGNLMKKLPLGMLMARMKGELYFAVPKSF